MANDVFIKNGMVTDGTGSPAIRADVIIKGERIEDVGLFPDARASKVIDVKGLVVAPGFIDCHTHLDFFIPSPRHPDVLESYAHQGVTTFVAGNCGWSPAPINHDFEDTFSTYWNFALPHDGLKYEWSTMGEYLDYLERNGQAFNVAILTGHNSLRTNVMGFQARFASPKEINGMKKMLKESLDGGSIGLSLGLYYCPGIFSNTDEIMDLASVMTEFKAPLVPHTRGLSGTYDKAVEEVIKIAEENKIPLHISHHASFGAQVRARAIKAINEAMDRGVEIGHDNIPWFTGSTTFLSLLPPWLFDGGFDGFFRRIQDPEVRKIAVHELKNHVPTWPTWENRWWTDKFFTLDTRLSGFRKEENRRFEFMSIKEIAKEINKDPYDTAFDLIIQERGKLFSTSGFFDDPKYDEHSARLLSDPNCSIISDIIGADLKTPNPVAYGAFTKVLGLFVRDMGVMTMEEAVRKMTSLPAKQMRLKDRGILKKGSFADVTVFNPKTVNNRASFSNPYRLSEGIEHLLINGQVVLEKGRYGPDLLAGKVIRRML